MTNVTVKATALIQFMSDESIKVKLSTHEGVTPRKIDAAGVALMRELGVKRTAERVKGTVELEKRRQAEAAAKTKSETK